MGFGQKQAFLAAAEAGFSQQPKFSFLPEAERGGTDVLGRANPGMGRTARYNPRTGHFPGPARQLTSPAQGRATLQPRGVHG